MAEDYLVFVEALARMGTQLGSSREGVAAVLGAMGDGAHGDLGTPDLDAACVDFHGSWSYGLGRLGECVDATRAGVDATATVYAQSDAAVGDAFTRLGGAL